MSHIYLANCATEGKTKVPLHFPKEVELSRETLRQCLGKGLHYAQTPALLGGSNHYRKNENFLSCDCMAFDIDGEGEQDRAKWNAKFISPLYSLSLAFFAYPSNSYKLHVFLPLSRRIDSGEDYIRIYLILLLRFLSLFPPESASKPDTSCSDLSRCFYPGAPVENPDEWIVAVPGEPVDVDAILASAPSEGELKAKVRVVEEGPIKKNNKSHVPDVFLEEISSDKHTEGIRHKTTRNAALYIVSHSSSEAGARKWFNEWNEDTELPQNEVDSIWKWALQRGNLSKDVWRQEAGSKKKITEEEVAAAVDEIRGECKRHYRRAIYGRNDTRRDERLESGEVYELFENEVGSGCGYAEPREKTDFSHTVEELIEDVGGPLAYRLRNAKNKQFSIDMLSNTGLVLNTNSCTYFRNGIFKIQSAKGKKWEYHFEPLQKGQYLEHPFEWDYMPYLRPRAIQWLNTYFPKRAGEKTSISVEGAIFLDFLRATFGRLMGDQQNLNIQGHAGAGKSTCLKQLVEAIGVGMAHTLPAALLSPKDSRFAWEETKNSYMVFADDLPVTGAVSGAMYKRLISIEEDMRIEPKGKKVYHLQKLWHLLVICNELYPITNLDDKGLNRKARVIEARADFMEKRGDIAALTEEEILDIRSLVCAALRMPQLPEYIWEEYPKRKDWIEEGSLKALFSDLLKESDNPKTTIYVSTLQEILLDAHSIKYRMRDSDICRKLITCGYYEISKSGEKKIPRDVHGKPYIRGYVVNTASAVWKASQKIGLSTSDFVEGEDEEGNSAALTWTQYYKNAEKLMKGYCSYLDAMIEGGENAEVGGSLEKVQSEPVMSDEEDRDFSDFSFASGVCDDSEYEDDISDEERAYYGWHTVQTGAERPFSIGEVQEEKESLKDKPALMDSGPDTPSLSPFAFDPPASGSVDMEMCKAYFEPWFKQNCVTTSVEGARWCGRQWGKNASKTFPISSLDIVTSLLPPWFLTPINIEATRNHPQGRFVLSLCQEENMKEQIAQSFLTSFNCAL